MSKLYDLYKKLGNQAYGKAIGEIAPYFTTVEPHFIELKPGFCEIYIENRREIHNHLGFIHVIAICNAAELVAGVLTDVSIPENHHWIPVGMQTEYLARAETTVRVVSNAKNLDWEMTGKVSVPVEAYDAANIMVFRAKIDMLLRNKK